MEWKLFSLKWRAVYNLLYNEDKEICFKQESLLVRVQFWRSISVVLAIVFILLKSAFLVQDMHFNIKGRYAFQYQYHSSPISLLIIFHQLHFPHFFISVEG